MISEDTLARADAELALAENARMSGFEGRARVSARRAAGIVTRGYLVELGIPIRSTSAYDVLNYLRDRPESTKEMRSIVDQLLMRVNQDHQIPGGVDLIAETRRLIQILKKD
jgi:HEPN domain-containing protein